MEINTWPGWQCVKKLGEGAFGKVYEIQCQENGQVRKAALKIMSFPSSPDDVKNGYLEGWYADEQGATTYYDSIINEFTKEIWIMSALKNCSNIVSYEEHMVCPHEGWAGADVLIRMELLQDFNKYKENHVIDDNAILKLGIDICSALEVCHNAKPPILHRDIKLANIMVDNQGNFKLGDFGVSKIVEGTKSAHTIAGTENYMAPEVILGKGYRATADIYSLGIVLYRLLNNNRNPFLPIEGILTASIQEEAKYRRINGEMIPMPRDGSPMLKNIVLKAISYYPTDRFQNVSEMKQYLIQCLEGSLDEEQTIQLMQVQEKTVKSSEETTKLDLSGQNTVTNVNENKSGRFKIIALVAVIAVIALLGVNAIKKPDRKTAGTENPVTDSPDTETSNGGGSSANEERYVSIEESQIEVGNSTKVAYYVDDFSYRSGDSVTWKSSNENVATVDDEGQVLAVSAGIADIIGIVDNIECKATVSVIDNTVSEKAEETNSNGFTPSYLDDGFIIRTGSYGCNVILKGDSITPSIQSDSSKSKAITFSRGNTQKLKWSVDDTSVAEVTVNGVFKAKENGTVKLTATYDNAVQETMDVLVTETRGNGNIQIKPEYENIMIRPAESGSLKVYFSGSLENGLSIMAYPSSELEIYTNVQEFNTEDKSVEISYLNNIATKGVEGYITVLLYNSEKSEVVASKKIYIGT